MDGDLLLQLRQSQSELAFRGSNSAKDIGSDQLHSWGAGGKCTRKITHPKTMLKINVINV